MKPSKDELIREIARLREELKDRDEQNRQLLDQLNKALEDKDDNHRSTT